MIRFILAVRILVFSPPPYSGSSKHTGDTKRRIIGSISPSTKEQQKALDPLKRISILLHSPLIFSLIRKLVTVCETSVITMAPKVCDWPLLSAPNPLSLPVEMLAE